jgi:hypothetical protein
LPQAYSRNSSANTITAHFDYWLFEERRNLAARVVEERVGSEFLQKIDLLSYRKIVWRSKRSAPL